MLHIVTLRPCRIGDREAPPGYELRLDPAIAEALVAAGDARLADSADPAPDAEEPSE